MCSTALAAGTRVRRSTLIDVPWCSVSRISNGHCDALPVLRCLNAQKVCRLDHSFIRLKVLASSNRSGANQLAAAQLLGGMALQTSGGTITVAQSADLRTTFGQRARCKPGPFRTRAGPQKKQTNPPKKKKTPPPGLDRCRARKRRCRPSGRTALGQCHVLVIADSGAALLHQRETASSNAGGSIHRPPSALGATGRRGRRGSPIPGISIAVGALGPAPHGHAAGRHLISSGIRKNRGVCRQGAPSRMSVS